MTINCTDSRGYRSIAALVDPDMRTVINRPYSITEKMALQQILVLVGEAYESLGLVAQLKVAGNNSHEFDPKTCETVLGTPTESSMLHGHVIGRGNPDHDYIRGVLLNGPAPGLIFNMKGGELNSPGNERKELWTEFEMDQVARTVADRLLEAFLKSGFEKKFGIELEELR